MLYVLASDPLAPWGEAAAIVILLYTLVSILVGLALVLGLTLGFSWAREKAELVKKLRPIVDSVNATAQAATKGALPAAGATDNKVVRSVAEIPAYARTIEEKVDQGSNRVASTVIEFRARTEMAKTVLKAFFLPGLTHRPQTVLQQEGLEFKSPGYRMLVEEAAPGEISTEPGSGYAGAIRPSQIRDVAVEDVVSSPQETQSISTEARHVPTH